MRYLTIKRRVQLLAIIPIVLLTLTFAVYHTLQRCRDFDNLLNDRGNSIIHELSSASSVALMTGNQKILQHLTDTVEMDADTATVSIFDRNQQLSAYSGPPSLQPSALPFMEHIAHSIDVQSHAHTLEFIAPIFMPKLSLDDYSHHIGSSDEMDAFSSINQRNPIIGWLDINLDRDATQLRQYQALLNGLLIFIVGILISLMLSRYLANIIIQPISSIKRTLDRIRDGNWDVNFTKKSHDELGEIATNIEYLLALIKQQNQDSQEQLAEATRDLQQTLEAIEIQNVELDLAVKTAKENNRRKSEFIANLSHEIRTPMNAVLGFTHLLMETSLTPEQDDYLKMIHKSATNLLSVISDILDFSKMESGKLTLDEVSVDLHECVNSVLLMLAPQAHAKHVELISMIHEQVPSHMVGDPIRIKQIITNLVNNAIKYTHEGYISVEIYLEEESAQSMTLRFAITDTGVGLSEKEKKLLFQAFSQADKSKENQLMGTGLGLLISKQLVECMGGEIGVESQVNEGSQFWFTLKTKRINTPEHAPVNYAPLQGFTVLLHDEQPKTQIAIQQILEKWSVVVSTTSSLAEFESRVKTGKFHVALLGSQLFEEDQHQWLTEISRFQPDGKTPLFLLLNSPKNSLIKSFAKLSVGVLTKPIHERRLYNALTSIHSHANKVVKPAGKMIQLFIADDNAANLKLLSSLLNSQHIQITTARNGSQSLALALQHPFDLILLDMQMPVFNGIEVAKQIRESQNPNQRTPIVIVTAQITDPEKNLLFHVGINDYLLKPVTVDDLHAMLFKWLGDQIAFLFHDHTSTHPQKADIIDWQSCLKLANNQVALANQLIAEFMSYLPKSRQIIEQCYAEDDIENLRAELHKLYGGCCYCDTPRLKKAIHVLQQALKHSPEQVKECFEHLREEIKAVMDAYDELRTTTA